MKTLFAPFWFLRFVWRCLSYRPRYYLKHPIEMIVESFKNTITKHRVTPSNFLWMKTLLLLIVFTVQVYGQKPNFHKWHPPPDTSCFVWYQAKTPITLEDWQEWVKVCRAESGLVGYRFIISESENGSISQESRIIIDDKHEKYFLHCYPEDYYATTKRHYKRYEKTIEHQDPNNFGEFMEWMERKQKSR